MVMMGLRRAIGIGSAALRSAAYLRRASPSSSLFVPRPPVPSRTFAAPPQVKRNIKDDDDDAAGPRINNDITSPFVRLVTDQGHSVVPRHEALQLASRMDLDLVEVHRKSDPPVCKIMDFHKEKYKKDVKEKERLKTKSAIVLRGGENKEVRFKGKTELKDLKVKADGITRLMERGYRVKCMAMPSGNEEEDLGGPLSRLLGLIQDVCIVESGPHLDSKHAYVIVRHVKFATKKAGKKASKAMEDAGKGARKNSSELSTVMADSGDETTEHGNRLILDEMDKKPSSLSSEFSTQKDAEDRVSRRELNLLKSNLGNYHGNMQNVDAGGPRISSGQRGAQTSERGLGSKNVKSNVEKQKTNEDVVPAETNRYANRRQQIRGDNQGLNQDRSPQGHRRNENEVHYLVNDNQRPLQQHSQQSPRFNNGRLPQEPRRYERGGHIPLNTKQGHFQQMNHPAESAGNGAGKPTPATKSFGIFSSRKPATSELRKANGASTGRDANTDVPKTYGIFSTPRRESGDKSS
ncbi:translation initiation factor IF3-1, mitochondrial [Oryza brachyantha]|uniref:Translation initiation factor 3 N-terminal domain-containing protein n=1 Tax=Oryza brachyantha TaxID=4533 RepID=J3L8P6_ORYBR|nr:translation initiation factor IF3-1, mitochondrial [Oryza brachyantha]